MAPVAHAQSDSARENRRFMGANTGEGDARAAPAVPLFPGEFCEYVSPAPARLSRRCRRRAICVSHRSRELGE
eukprot:5497136-Pyramimonas_sp.AAC.1